MSRLLIAALALATMATAASAQQRTFYESGRVVGRSFTDANGAVKTYDSQGRIVSRSQTSGNQTTVRDAGGHTVGRFTR